jgi:hypothetical protein
MGVKPNVELHIEELVLHGFQPADRYRIGAAVERELLRLITEQGLPGEHDEDLHLPHLNAGEFSMPSGVSSEAAGREIAHRVHASLSGSARTLAAPGTTGGNQL